MSGGRDFQSTLTWIGGGLVIALMAFLGLDSGGTQEPAPKKPSTSQGAPYSNFTSIEGMRSLPGLMWDDPFEHVSDPQLTDLPPTSDLKTIIEEQMGPDGRIMYLVVPVQSGFGPDSLESRRRKRHAVELATANQGFSLTFPDRMSYRRVKVDYHFASRDVEKRSHGEASPAASADAPSDAAATPDRSDSKTADTSATTAVPLDLYLPTKLYKSKDSNDFILITWVQEGQLGKQPLSTIQAIIEPIMVEDDVKKHSAAFCVLGPTYSDSLRDLITDGKLMDDSHTKTLAFYQGWGLGATICNISCTASDQSLGLSAGQAYIPIGTQKDLKIFHTIGSDDRLLSVLERELTLRDAWLESGSGGKFVIFAEQSSLSYIDGMQKSLYGASQEQQPIVIPYLKDIASVGSQAGSADRPLDSSSVRDYLDRTMAELVTAESSRLINPSRVRTVGILGSSWEDKNLILERARKIFPVATFFTTELDARFNLPEYNAHTRNLVVASHYGLGVRGRSAFFGSVDNIPSFRDGYQTSAFIGMSVLCYAFRENRLSDSKCELSFGRLPQDLFDLVGRRQRQTSESLSQAYLQPLAFEIGNKNPIQLPSTQSPEYLPLRQPEGVMPIHERGSLLFTILVTVLGAILIFNFLAAFSTDASKFRDAFSQGFVGTGAYLKSFFFGSSAEKLGAVWSIFLPTLLGGLLVCVMAISDRSLDSEPIMFAGGISIWPTICGLYAVIALSIREIIRPLPDLSVDAETAMKPPQRSLAWKLAFTIAILFYLTSFLESGFIQPPARDWLVRWLANALLFMATLCILVVTCKCLLFSLYARKVIENFRGALPSDVDAKTIDPKVQESMVHRCRTTMKLSIEASRRLLWPATLSILFIAARWNWWDSWGQDKSWVALLATPIVISFVAAIVVRVTAVRYRNDTVEFLRRWHYDLFVSKTGGKGKDEASLLEESTEEITRLDRGPFGPLSRDYLLGAAGLLVTILFTGPLGALVSRVFTFLP